MADSNDVIGNEVLPLPVILYGRSQGDGTQRIRERLEELRISFVEYDVEEDEDAAQFVEGVSRGQRHIPVVVFGDQEILLADPSAEELDQSLRRAGYKVEQ